MYFKTKQAANIEYILFTDWLLVPYSSVVDLPVKMITVNVGGRRYNIPETQLLKYADSLLSRPESNEYYYDSSKQEYFFDRDPDMFKYVYQFYTTGKLHCPYEYEFECWQLYRDEMEFFGICLDNFTSNCCLDDYLDNSRNEDDVDTPTKLKEPVSKENHEYTFRGRIRRGLEDPLSSYIAKCFHVFIGLVIVVNISCNAIETSPCTINKTCGECYPNTFFIINVLCVPIFTAEYLLGIIVSPSPWQHVCHIFNIIDLMAIIPFYINILLTNMYQGQNLQPFAVLRVFRIFRVLKFARYSHKLVDLFRSIKKS